MLYCAGTQTARIVMLLSQNVPQLRSPHLTETQLKTSTFEESHATGAVTASSINVFPSAIGSMLPVTNELTGEYICRAERDENGRDTLVIAVLAGVPSLALPASDGTDLPISPSTRRAIRQRRLVACAGRTPGNLAASLRAG